MTDNTEAPLRPLPERDFNAWWLSLPEGRRHALIDDKWMLAYVSYEAGRAARVQQPAQVDIKALAKRAKLPKYMYDTEGGCDALSRLVAIALGDSVAPTVQPSGATVEPGASSQWISVDERLPEYRQPVCFVVRCSNPSWSHLHGRVLGGVYVGGPFGGFNVPGLAVDATHWMPSPTPPTLEPGASAERSSEGEQP